MFRRRTPAAYGGAAVLLLAVALRRRVPAVVTGGPPGSRQHTAARLTYAEAAPYGRRPRAMDRPPLRRRRALGLGARLDRPRALRGRHGGARFNRPPGNPTLMEARAKWRHADTKPFDKVILRILLPLGTLQPAVAGLDAVRFRWSSMPVWLAYAGAILFALGMALITWTMSVNRFAEPTVRIQTDRGHTVVTSGPYRLHSPSDVCGHDPDVCGDGSRPGLPLGAGIGGRPRGAAGLAHGPGGPHAPPRAAGLCGLRRAHALPAAAPGSGEALPPARDPAAAPRTRRSPTRPRRGRHGREAIRYDPSGGSCSNSM